MPGRTLILRKPTQHSVGVVLRECTASFPEAVKCIDLMREDVRLRETTRDAETPWTKLAPERRLSMQGELVDFEHELNLKRARLCLRADSTAEKLSDEELTLLCENDSGFVDEIEKLCGVDREDPTGANDNPLASP